MTDGQGSLGYSLFRIASSNNATVAYLWDMGGGGHWEVQFGRPFQDWEIKELTQFLDLIHPLRVQEDTFYFRKRMGGEILVSSIL